MPTRSEHLAEHGSHRTRWLAVLGAVLVMFGIGLGWVGPALVGLMTPDPVPPDPSGPVLPPYIAEPAVSFDAAPPRPHPETAAPVRLVVPRLGVDAPVIPAHVSEGTLWPPDDPQTLGWWAEGAKPGQVTGGTLLTGHTVHSGGGAFDNLEDLGKGDVVRVRTPKGTIGYLVSGVTIYRKASLAKDAARVFSQTVPGRLVLITCEDWNGEGYDSNAVVFAERWRDRRFR